MTVLTIFLAFLAGSVSFASPCCLPLVPAEFGEAGDGLDTFQVPRPNAGPRHARRLLRLHVDLFSFC